MATPSKSAPSENGFDGGAWSSSLFSFIQKLSVTPVFPERSSVSVASLRELAIVCASISR